MKQRKVLRNKTFNIDHTLVITGEFQPWTSFISIPLGHILWANGLGNCIRIDSQFQPSCGQQKVLNENFEYETIEN